MNTAPNTLKNYQDTHKLTQHFMAQSLGISQATYNNWINKQTAINPKYLHAIAKLCKVEVESLISPNTKIKITNPASGESESYNALEMYRSFNESLLENNQFLKTENAQLKEQNENQSKTIAGLEAKLKSRM